MQECQALEVTTLLKQVRTGTVEQKPDTVTVKLNRHNVSSFPIRLKTLSKVNVEPTAADFTNAQFSGTLVFLTEPNV